MTAAQFDAIEREALLNYYTTGASTLRRLTPTEMVELHTFLKGDRRLFNNDLLDGIPTITLGHMTFVGLNR